MLDSTRYHLSMSPTAFHSSLIDTSGRRYFMDPIAYSCFHLPILSMPLQSNSYGIRPLDWSSEGTYWNWHHISVASTAFYSSLVPTSNARYRQVIYDILDSIRYHLFVSSTAFYSSLVDTSRHRLLPYPHHLESMGRA